MPSLSESQLRTLVSAIDRIVPQDDFPSASQAGCLDFLVRLIELERLGATYASGLDGLEHEASLLGHTFSELSPPQQDAVLAACEVKESDSAWLVSPQQFLRILATQTIEGYYSDPGNGGNLGAVSWKMIGFKVTA